MTKKELQKLLERKAIVKEREEAIGYDPQRANILVNTTDEDIEILFDGKPYVIKSGKEKPFANYIIALFIAHHDGLEVKEEEEEVVEEEEEEKPKKKATAKK